MKKFGFTLSELIVALTVVGVAAGIVVPTVSKFLPDTKKVIVLNYNNLINTAITKYYSSVYFDRSIADCRGLSCFKDASSDGYANFGEYLLAELDVENVIEDGQIKKGVAPDGVGVELKGPLKDGSYDIVLDTDMKHNGCCYSQNCTKFKEVDSFALHIDTDGEITPGDPLTNAYFRNQYSMNNKEKDIKKAEKILLEDIKSNEN